MRTVGLLLLGFLFLSQSVMVLSQEETEKQYPVFSCDEMVHDFGKIRELEGFAVHEFVIKNTGKVPLIINRVMTSCGCAQPEWSHKPIEPGEEGFVIISYDMTNRPGPFEKRITVFTNERLFRQSLTIKGEVIPRPERLNVLFHDTIGSVQMEQVDFEFGNVRPHQTQKTEIWIQNFSKEQLKLSVTNDLKYVNVIVPERLDSDFPEKMIVEVDASKVDSTMRGRKLGAILWKTEDPKGEVITQSIPVNVNFIDDFTFMTPDERANAPVIKFSATSLDYGKLNKKRVAKELVIMNTGKSALKLHSVMIENPEVVQFKGLKKNILQPNESQKLKIYVNPKDVQGNFRTDLCVVSNDPRKPVDYVRIEFEK
ncbi:MAG: DUF1573 domain-containing protein [Tannerella sp.]|jgi:hypothetical protein|nr:DUF1573 domain-containing protein [Tannerella sp.]